MAVDTHGAAAATHAAAAATHGAAAATHAAAAGMVRGKLLAAQCSQLRSLFLYSALMVWSPDTALGTAPYMWSAARDLPTHRCKETSGCSSCGSNHHRQLPHIVV